MNIKSIFVGIALSFTLICATLITWIYSQIDSSLPQLSGKQTLYGLSTAASIERDKQGIATITGQNRIDIAVATGFVHAQERFFQMDLLRKNSAGELASLFGNVAVQYDTAIRLHRFRERAREIVNQLPEKQIAILKAYTQGVNQGLSSLNAVPFEYLILQQEPVKWQEEDTILAVFSMYIDLQYSDGARELTLGLIKSAFGDKVYQFLNPNGSQWDATIDNSTFPAAEMPALPWRINHQAKSTPTHQQLAFTVTSPLLPAEQEYHTESFPGSNSWAVSGNISQTGSAIVANDMHLNIRVPNTWFRAAFNYVDETGKPVNVNGLTLPGTPNMVTGSNGHIAWGFTNSYGDYSDVILLETNEDESQYLTPDGYRSFDYHKQIIAVKDEAPHEIEVKETIWGPVIGKNSEGELLAYRWVAHDKQAVNLEHLALETTKNTEQAFAVAATAGIPSQNFLVADNQGNIGWTIMGPIPIKQGNIGDIPASWANGSNAWQGYLTANEYPALMNPKDNRLWTANSRVVGGDMLNKLGNGGYALGARAQQIKQNLFSQPDFDEQDLLTIALDDKAIFLSRWKDFIVEQVLTAEQLTDNTNWQTALSILEAPDLKASVDSVAYRIVRNFRINVREEVFHDLNKQLSSISAHYSFATIRNQIETPLWQLINDQPADFSFEAHASWQSLFVSAFKHTIDDMTKDQALPNATWGLQNTQQIKHPLSNAVPFIGHWLDMPNTQLAGDSFMPRVQGTSFGASERMVVSPGHEENGILHMPTSQSGHPWSPFYGSGHEDWEQGNPSPFLPGPPVYKLNLISY